MVQSQCDERDDSETSFKINTPGDKTTAATSPTNSPESNAGNRIGNSRSDSSDDEAYERFLAKMKNCGTREKKQIESDDEDFLEDR